MRTDKRDNEQKSRENEQKSPKNNKKEENNNKKAENVTEQKVAGQPEGDAAILKRLKKTNNPRTVSGIKYFRCPVCLKEFSTHLYSGWVYKLHRNSHLIMFCGYTCMRKAESLCEDGRKKYKDGITE